MYFLQETGVGKEAQVLGRYGQGQDSLVTCGE
jgi:hypothetical protein